MIIRYEKLEDYHQIARLNYLAFSNWHPDKIFVHESEMISLARQRSTYDPELSIVAEQDGEIIGHVLLVPSSFIVLGKEIKGVLLGPIAVLPELQKSGIGAKLIKHGHKVAKDKGFEFSLLCGHPSYYPKHGYLQNVFSIAGTKIEVLGDSNKDCTLSERPLRKDDMPSINKWQHNMRKGDPLCILLDDDIMEYHSNSIEFSSIIITKGDNAIGFVRCFSQTPSNIKLLYCDTRYMDEILLYLSNKSDINVLNISQPSNAFENNLISDTFKVTDMRNTNDAFMICPLDSNSIINEYCHKVIEKEIRPGVISYPPYCDVDV